MKKVAKLTDNDRDLIAVFKAEGLLGLEPKSPAKMHGVLSDYTTSA